MNPNSYSVRLRSRAAVIAIAAILAASRVPAIDAGGIDVHGSVSVTASYSDTYNYLGETADQAKLNVVDAVLNGTHRFDNGLRVGAQLYAYKIGHYTDLTLDWANLDYSVQPWFGIRLGRNKITLGLYNDSQDLDAVRTFASLPFSFYPKTYRAITSSCDGLNLYGNVALGRGGSLDYAVYGGWKEDIEGDNPFVRGRNNLAQYAKWDVQGGVFGASLFWNVPVDGLRLGYSYFIAPDNQLRGVLSDSSWIYGEFAALPVAVDRVLGTGAWDHSGLFAGTPVVSDVRVSFQAISAEYTRGKWLWAAEYKQQDNTRGVIYTPALARLGRPTRSPFTTNYEFYYGMVTYQATSQLGLGLYYSYENLSRRNSRAAHDPLNHTRDWAAAISYAVNDSWIVKLEGHLLDGRSQVLTSGDDNRRSGTDNSWGYLLAKTTFSF